MLRIFRFLSSAFLRGACFCGAFLGLSSSVALAQNLELRDVVKALELHSLELADNRAQFESLLAEGRSELEWEYPSLATNIGTGRDNGKIGVDWGATLSFRPKLWWVNPLLRDSIASRGLQYKTSQNLILNMSFIAAKRTYLTYMATKEKYKYYLKREENFLRLLSIARKRLKGGSISNKDLVSFEAAYLDSQLATVSVRNDLLELQRTLFSMLGLDKQGYLSSPKPEASDSKASEAEARSSMLASDDGDIFINDLNFSYLDLDSKTLEDKLNNSPYTEILDLQAKEFQSRGRYEGRNLWDSLEFGAGVNYSASYYNPTFQVTVPLPVSRKQSFLKAKYMALESGALTKMDITKKQLAIKAKAYLRELDIQRNYINVAEKNIKVKQDLARLSRLGYESQQVTLFEYITQENAFVDSQIELVNSQIKYIDLVSLLEETIGESFTAIN